MPKVRSGSISRPRERRGAAHLEELCLVEAAEELNERGDQTGPARLMAGADSGPVVPVEVFIEEQMIAPLRVALDLNAIYSICCASSRG
jgi:hypothetical protein